MGAPLLQTPLVRALGSAVLFELQTETLLGRFYCKQQLFHSNKGKLPSLRRRQ